MELQLHVLNVSLCSTGDWDKVRYVKSLADLHHVPSVVRSAGINFLVQ